MNIHRYSVSLVVSILFVSLSESQLIDETVFPHLPYENNTSSIGISPNGFYVSGNSWMDYNWPPPIDQWGTISQPYFILSPEKLSRKVIYLPDVESSESFGFGGNGNIITQSQVFTAADSLFVIWSNRNVDYTDVGPFLIFDTSTISLAKLISDSLAKIYTISDGLHPSILSDENNMLHFAWEDVTQLDTLWGSKYSIYSSSIFYQNRNTLGEYSVPTMVGKGFLPNIKLKNDDVYIFFIAADSSNQQTMQLSYCKGDGQTFSPPILLQQIQVNPYSFSDLAYRLSQLNFRWDVDDNGNIHVAWRETYPINKTFVLHYSSINGTQIDSIDDANAQVRFMDNGETRIFSVLSSSGDDSSQFRSFVSQMGTAIDTLNIFAFPPQTLLNQIFVDVEGNDHGIINNGTKSFLLKYASTDSAQLFSLSGEYTISPTSYVDTNNRVWLTGKRDSTSVLLNFSLSEIGTHQDFIFPLRIGNEWHYGVYSDPPPIFPDYTDIQKVVANTLMPNSIKYFVIEAQMHPIRYLRKEGLKVFQYNPTDSTEHLRYDFSRFIGDTISKSLTPPYKYITLTGINFLDPVNFKYHTFHFEGAIIDQQSDGLIQIADSIGIVQTGWIGPTWKLMGAKINGKIIYGTLLSVDEESEQLPLSFSLSQNYPNPFNPVTTIGYTIPSSGNVSLKVYDILGREVAVLMNGYQKQGKYSVTFNASELSSGVYFYRIQSGSYVTTKKMTLLR